MKHLFQQGLTILTFTTLVFISGHMLILAAKNAHHKCLSYESTGGNYHDCLGA